MFFKRVVAWSLCAAAFAAPLGAQQPQVRADTTVTRSFVTEDWPSWEIGIMGVWNGYDDLTSAPVAGNPAEEIDDQFGYGALFAGYLAKHWALEFEVTGAPMDVDKIDGDGAWNTNLAGRLVANIGGTQRFLGLLGVGLVRTGFSAPIQDQFSYTDGVQGLVGFKFGLGRVVGLRIDGVYNAHVFNGDAEDMNNWQVRGGLTFALPRRSEVIDTRINTTETITRVDTVTVQAEAPPQPTGPAELRQAIFFEFDSDRITDQGRATLDNTVIPYLRDNNVTAIAVGGYADQCGPIPYNDALAYRRARTVGDYIKIQLPNVNVKALGAGEREPVEDKGNARRTCRSETNRRAEFFIDITGTGVSPTGGTETTPPATPPATPPEQR